MKRRYVSLVLVLAALMALCAPARGDVLWEPNNSFYEGHRDQCDYIGRQFYANGDEGFITLWDAPGGTRVMHQFQNGYTLWIYYQYEDWACAVVWGDEGEIAGWAPMADFVLKYDYLSFAEEYADEIRPYNGEFAEYTGTGEILVWEYPGASVPKDRWDYDKEMVALLTGSAGQESYISEAFVDEEGLTWGFVGYLWGRWNGWVCLDDPSGETFPVREVGTPELTAAQEPAMPARGYVPYILSGVLVVAVAAAAAVLLARRKKRP